jgi:small subunit ribosomal protein S2
MKELLEAGVHFGHQTRRWNPKMKRYIFGARNGIYIIDLQQTVALFEEAYRFVVETVGQGGMVLFVGTTKQAQEAIREESTRCEMCYVNNRWLGGMFTNFQTIRKNIERLKTLEAMKTDGTIAQLTKKEALSVQREIAKLEKTLGGIKEMDHLPAAVFVVDPKKERIAVAETRKLGIPCVGLVDTNCDPDDVNFVIPSNDDAIRAIRLFTSKVADACVEGRRRLEERIQLDERKDVNEDEQVKVQGAEEEAGNSP